LAGHSSQHNGYEEMLLKQPVQELLSPIKQFLFLQSSSGILLLFCTAIALALANSSQVEDFRFIRQVRVPGLSDEEIAGGVQGVKL
jgi:hypothetical protein